MYADHVLRNHRMLINCIYCTAGVWFSHIPTIVGRIAYGRTVPHAKERRSAPPNPQR
jgi:hypothetical protein